MKKKILITEDDPGIQEVFRIILEMADYDVQIYSDASAIIEGNFENPDIFILDKQLSGTDGLQLCNHLKRNKSTHSIPVMIVSATAELGRLVKGTDVDDTSKSLLIYKICLLKYPIY